MFSIAALAVAAGAYVEAQPARAASIQEVVGTIKTGAMFPHQLKISVRYYITVEGKKIYQTRSFEASKDCEHTDGEIAAFAGLVSPWMGSTRAAIVRYVEQGSRRCLVSVGL